jgi:hypothetical protein
MRWHSYIITILVLLSAGFMTFDGLRAFVTGDYTTPKSGPYANRLGPWSKLVQAMGLAPRSNLMKGIHVVLGLTTLFLLACFLRKLAWAPKALLAASIAGLWHLPFGTLANLIVIGLLLWAGRGTVP